MLSGELPGELIEFGPTFRSRQESMNTQPRLSSQQRRILEFLAHATDWCTRQDKGVMFQRYAPHHSQPGQCAITDAGLAHLRPLTKLKRMFFPGMRYTDSELKVIGNVSELGSLYLTGNEISDAGLARTWT